MSVDIDFANISIKDALDLAILVEEEAEERYRELADNLEFHNTKDAARFFRFMMTCEAKHGEELSAKRQELFRSAGIRDCKILHDVARSP
jgi:rubrerythrin